MTSHGHTVYLAIKFHADHRNRELVDRISAVFERHGLMTVSVARDFEQWGQVTFDAHDLMQRAFDAIHHSAAVVVEFTEKGVGLGIEAGYAAALDIPVFVLLRPEAEVSTTLDGISTEVFRYTDDDSLNSAAARISDTIGRVADRP
jgi:nucleoside 2-deoxyribosyltransferase